MSPENNATGFPAAFRQPAKSHPNDAICGHGRRPCPICTRPMVVHWMFGIGIDACPDHGEWYDTGELDQLAAAVAREKREEQRHEEAENEVEARQRENDRWLRYMAFGGYALFVELFASLFDFARQSSTPVPTDQVPPAFRAAYARPPRPHPNEEKVAHGRRPCPVCSGVMAAELRFGVTTDVCRPHGMWVDAGEAEGMVRDVRWAGT